MSDNQEPKLDILKAYSARQLSQREAVRQLGMRDSTELLVALGDADLPYPIPSEAQLAEEVEAFRMIWRGA